MNDEVIMCRDGFASVHGIGNRRVRRIASHLHEGLSPHDGRGRHNSRPRAITDEIKAMIYAHIASFPFRVSHYSACGKKRTYLSCDLSIAKLYMLFLNKEYPDVYLEAKKGEFSG